MWSGVGEFEPRGKLFETKDQINEGVEGGGAEEDSEGRAEHHGSNNKGARLE